MINLIWYINKIKKPIKENAQKRYDAIVNPNPGTFCVCTDNWNGKWNNMTKEDIEKLQEEYDENYEEEMSEYKITNEFIKKWKGYDLITEEQYQELISNDYITRLIYLFRCEGKVMIIIGDWDDDDINDYLLKYRMNWSDRIV